MNALIQRINKHIEDNDLNQSEICRALGFNRFSFNRGIKQNVMGIGAISKLYNHFGWDFDMVEELQDVIHDRMDHYKSHELKSVIGLTYSSARHFANNGGASMKAIKALYTNDTECNRIISKYF